MAYSKKYEISEQRMEEWSTFVKERKLKANNNLRFTSHEEDEISIFYVEVNPGILIE